NVFSTPYLQVGPLYLYVEGIVGKIAPALGLEPLRALSVFWSGVILLWVVAVADRVMRAMFSPAARRRRCFVVLALSARLPLPLVLAPGTAFGVAARCAQGVVVVVAVGIAAARYRHAGGVDVSTVVGLLVTARLATDPYPQSYYVAPLLLLLILSGLASSQEVG